MGAYSSFSSSSFSESFFLVRFIFIMVLLVVVVYLLASSGSTTTILSRDVAEVVAFERFVVFLAFFLLDLAGAFLLSFVDLVDSVPLNGTSAASPSTYSRFASTFSWSVWKLTCFCSSASSVWQYASFVVVYMFAVTWVDLTYFYSIYVAWSVKICFYLLPKAWTPKSIISAGTTSSTWL